MQSDYISRQEAIYNFKTRKDFLRQWVEKESQRRIGINIAIDVVKAMPSADLVPVVRCRDCKYYEGRNWCGLNETDFDPDDFCSYGERRE